ncbi:MAG: hypothetical protein ACOZIN_18750 [Myxococcota bacterium]
MTIDFTCQKCEGSFELDAQDLIDGSEKLECPNCGAKAPSSMVEDFTSALSELKARVATLSKRFAVNLAVETEELDEGLEDEGESDEEEGEDELDFDEDDEDEEDEREDEDMDDR